MLRPVRIRHYLAVMQQSGIPSAEVLRGTGIEAARLQDANYLIEAVQCRRVIANMIRLSHNPAIGFEVGERAEPPDLGIIGYAVMSCSSMRQTLGLWAQYGQSLVGVMSRLAVEEGPEGQTVKVVEPAELDAIHQFCVEEILVMMYRIGSILTGGVPLVTRLQFAYPAPAHSRRYHDFFRCPIHFAAPKTSATIAKAWLDAPLRTTDEEFNRICVEHCGQILQQIERSSPIASRLRDLFLKNPSALPRLEVAARTLGVSARTLRRHLQEEGSSYQALVDRFRADLAREYLRGTQIAPKEVGYLLGFKDPATFRRAFKGWTGQTIGDYREGFGGRSPPSDTGRH